MRQHTAFSFIVTSYNLGRYLGECLESLFTQDYDPGNFEIVCVDDGSTDDSLQILRHLAKSVPNFRCLHTDHSGLEIACNTGIRAARYERITRVDADDLLTRNFLLKMNEAIQEKPEFDFYYCKEYYEYHSPAEKIFKELPEFDPDEIFERGDFFATGTVYKRADLESVGFYPTGVKNCGLENYSVVLDLLAKGKKGLAVRGASFSYRRHGQNMSVLRREFIIEYGKQLLEKHGREFKTNAHHPYGLVLGVRT